MNEPVFIRQWQLPVLCCSFKRKLASKDAPSPPILPRLSFVERLDVVNNVINAIVPQQMRRRDREQEISPPNPTNAAS